MHTTHKAGPAWAAAAPQARDQTAQHHTMCRRLHRPRLAAHHTTGVQYMQAPPSWVWPHPAPAAAAALMPGAAGVQVAAVVLTALLRWLLISWAKACTAHAQY